MFKSVTLSLAIALLLTGSILITAPLVSGSAEPALSPMLMQSSTIVFNRTPLDRPAGKLDRAAESTVHEQSPPSLEPQGVAISFTYQGALTDSQGQPIAGPVGLNFRLIANDNGSEVTVSSTVFNAIMPDAQGRFQVLIPLVDASVFNSYTNHRLLVIDLESSSKIGAPTPIHPTPLAWAARHALESDYAAVAASADFADEADYAEQSDFSNYASEAGQLSNDQTIELTLESVFEPYGFGWDIPRATRVGNVVYLGGLVNPESSAPSGGIIARLPVGMRPIGRVLDGAFCDMSSQNTQNHIRIDILPNGNIQCTDQVFTNGWFSLNGISFIVE